MKILFFSHYFYPEGNAPASRVYEMAKCWIKEGHEVTVLTCAPNVPNGVVYDGYKNRFFQCEEIDGVKVVRVWTYMAANKGVVKRIMNFVSYMFSAIFFGLFVGKPDLIIATSPQFFCGWAGVVVSKFRRKPFILEIRDIWPESIVAVGANLGKRTISFLEKMEDWMYKAAYKIVTVGKGYKSRLVEKGVPEEKIDIVMNGLNTELFIPKEKSPELVKKWNLQNKFVCSYSGTIGMACGLDVALEAAKILKEKERSDICFLLVGDGAEKGNLEDKARKLELDNVIFTGRQPKETMPDYLATSDVSLVHLRKTDLFTTVMPSKIFESAGMERPIIIGVKGQATDIVLEAGAGVEMEPDDAQSLVDAVLKLADEPELCQSMGGSGREYMLKNYDRKKLASDYLDVLEQVLVAKR